MTTVTITGTIAGAYKLTTPVTVLSIASTGYIQGSASYGVYSPTAATGAYTVHNDGRINGGKYGIDLGGGTITNGSAAHTTATIRGGVDGVRVHTGAATVANYGTIASTGVGNADGVSLCAGGQVTNGSATDSAATIYGYGVGVFAYLPYGGGGHVSVVNFGTIKSVGTGVYTLGGSTRINNFSTIVSTGTSAFSRGISQLGGTVVNGSAADKTAMIGGYSTGIYADGAVVNYATIESHGTAVSTSGVSLFVGGSITNGSATDTTALISGANGVVTYGGAIQNFGTLLGSKRAGVYSTLTFSGYTTLTNGAPGDSSALIEGNTYGVRLAGGSIDNLGTIIGLSASVGAAEDAGVFLEQSLGGRANTMVNRGLVEGVNLGAFIVGTLINYGTIEATEADGYSVKIGGSLRVEPGSKLIGKVTGYGGNLDFASGKGVISRLGGGTISAGGAEYLNFGTLTVDQGAAFTTTGVGTIASGGVASLDIIGTLDVAGTLIVSGTLLSTGFYDPGHLTGAGHVEFLTGTSTVGISAYDIRPGVQLTTAHVLISGASTVINVLENLTVSGAVVQTDSTVNVAVTRQLKFTGVGDRLSGTLAGAGSVSMTGAGVSLSAITLSAARTTINAASAKFAGVIDVTSVLSLTSPAITISGVTQLTGGGTVQLSQLASNKIVGATAASLLENSDKLEGGGQLGGGQMRLTNEAGGTILAFGAVALTVDTGANRISNAGLIEATGAGGILIDSAVNNTGTLAAQGGNLAVLGAVTGAGLVSIHGAMASFAGAFSESVTFITNGELALGQSRTYAGTISGFSKTGATSLDLEDILFASASATYSGTTTSGVLTVTDGTHTAKIKLSGAYTGSTWALSDDGHGGVKVTDPPAAHLLTSAIAGFAPAAAMSARVSQPTGVIAHPLLAAPA